MENNFVKLASIDVSKHIEKKGNLSYLSWPFAVDQLMRADPGATWTFGAPEMIGETMMVFCTVTAFGKPIKMHLPVMDHSNKAIKNPDAVAVNKNMMRCLVKAIACHGLGLHIYAGEDLPLDEEGNKQEKPRVQPRPEPKAEPKPEPKQERVTPKTVEGKGGDWQMKITMLGDNDDPDEWIGIIKDTTTLALENAKSESDVMAIFRNNAPIFNRVKQISNESYDSLVAMFKDAKANFTKKETE